MWRKIFSVVLTTILIFNFVGSTTKASPSTEESKWMVISKLRSLNTALDNAYKGQYGLYYNLYYLTVMARWVDFMHDFKDSHNLQFSQLERDSYREIFIGKVEVFNSKFGEPVEEDIDFSYKNLKLTVSKEPSQFQEMLENIIAFEIPKYLENRLMSISILLEGTIDEKEKEKIISENSDSLRYIYKILFSLVTESNEMSNLIRHEEVLSVIESPNASDLMSPTGEYRELIEKGRSLESKEVNSIDNVALINSDEYLERLAFVKKKPEDQILDTDTGADLWIQTEGRGRDTDTYMLQDIYVRILAASAVYRPLISHVGDKDFLEALAGLSGDKRKEVLQLYDEVKDYRKPLYTVVDASRWFETDPILGAFTSRADGVVENQGSFPTYAGEAELLTLEKFLESVGKESLTGFVMMKCKFQADPDTNSYFYYSDNPKYSNSDSQVRANNVCSSATEKENSTKWTSTVMEVGGAANDGTGYYSASITLSLLTNYFKDNKILASIENKNSQYLYMNAFGDIVTKDNLVVLPGSANPKFYDLQLGYIPYTVAFMKGYPGVRSMGNKLVLGSDDDIGKYLFFSEGEGSSGKTTFVKIKGENNLATTVPRVAGWINLDLAEPIGGIKGALERTNLDPTLSGAWYTVAWNWVKKSVGEGKFTGQVYDNTHIVRKQDIIINQQNVFDYDPQNDPNYDIAKFIARNMYKSFTVRDGQELNEYNGLLKEDYIFRNVLLEALNGTIYATGYSKSMNENYEAMVEDTFSWFKRLVRDWTNEVVNTFGNVSGVLGIRDSYQDPIFGIFLSVTNTYFWYIVAIFFLIFLMKFMRDRATFLFMAFSAIMSLLALFLFIKVIPSYMPAVYNFTINNANQSVSYNILSMKSEKYFDTYRNSGNLDKNNNFVINTTSLNLYKLTQENMEEILRKYQISRDDVTAGKIYIVDGNNGLYIEGNTLKVNVDTLLYTNPIVGSYKDTEVGTIYQIESEKIYSSVLDYYTPYYMIQDGLIDTLNKLLMVYNIPKHSVQYGGGLNKDSFAVFNYINSGPFLTPGNYEQGTDGETGEQIEKLYYLFDNPTNQDNSYDFLGLDKLLRNPTPEIMESLWYRTLVQNRLLEGLKEEATDDEVKRYTNFIGSVNYVVKRFIIDLKPQVGLISDENLIKIISLYATTVFNQKASDLGNWVYPLALNYEEYKLNDVYLATFTDDYGRFMSVNMDVVNYVGENSGITAMLFLLVDTILSAIISYIIQFSLPIMYILAGVLLTIRYVAGTSMRGTFVGYLKVSLLLGICLTAYVWTLSWVSSWSILPALIGLLVSSLLFLFG